MNILGLKTKTLDELNKTELCICGVALVIFIVVGFVVGVNLIGLMERSFNYLYENFCFFK